MVLIVLLNMYTYFFNFMLHFNEKIQFFLINLYIYILTCFKIITLLFPLKSLKKINFKKQQHDYV